MGLEGVQVTTTLEASCAALGQALECQPGELLEFQPDAEL